MVIQIMADVEKPAIRQVVEMNCAVPGIPESGFYSSNYPSWQRITRIF
jgi:hypothetical protein